MDMVLLQRLATRPELLLEHLDAYAELVSVEAGEAASAIRRQALWFAMAGIGAAVALALSGVAALLASALPLATMPVPWALVLVPLAWWVFAGVCLWAAHRAETAARFPVLRAQWAADVALLRGRPAA